jgi:hypothetical protein
LFINKVSRCEAVLMSVLAPTSELLSFAWPKESNQRKGHQTAAYFLGSKAFVGGWQKVASCPFANLPHPCGNPNGLFPTKALVLGAADGKTTTLTV